MNVGRAIAITMTAFFAAFLALPLLVLVSGLASEDVMKALRDPAVLSALRLSVQTSVAVALLAVVFGTPVAYVLARKEFPGKRLLDSLIDLPMALPPVVAGMAVLMTYGRSSPIGSLFDHIGAPLVFTPRGIVVVQLFVASPFYIQSVRGGLEAVPRRVEEAARTLGASRFRTFFRVTLPLAWSSFLSGAILCWGRAIGEFGGTIMVGGNVAFRTRTMPLAILSAMESDMYAAQVLASMLLAFSFVVFFFGRSGLSRKGAAP